MQWASICWLVKPKLPTDRYFALRIDAATFCEPDKVVIIVAWQASDFCSCWTDLDLAFIKGSCAKKAHQYEAERGTDNKRIFGLAFHKGYFPTTRRVPLRSRLALDHRRRMHGRPVRLPALDRCANASSPCAVSISGLMLMSAAARQKRFTYWTSDGQRHWTPYFGYHFGPFRVRKISSVR